MIQAVVSLLQQSSFMNYKTAAWSQRSQCFVLAERNAIPSLPNAGCVSLDTYGTVFDFDSFGEISSGGIFIINL